MLKKVLSGFTACVLAVGVMPTGLALQTEDYAAVTIAPEVYSNVSRNYYEGNGGFTSNGKFISVDGFMAMDIWKDEWKSISEWSDNSAVNTLTFNGIDYQVKLTNPTKNTLMSGFASSSSTTDTHVNIDIPDGNYSGISFLGGADSSASSTTGVIRFNYSNNENSGWISYTQEKVSTESADALKVPAKKYSSGTVNDADYIYLHQINVMADSSKKMESVDVIVRNSVLESDGTVTLKSTSGAAGYKYYSRYVAMSMLVDEVQLEKEKVNKLEEIIDTLPTADEFEYSDENIEKLYEIRDIRETVDESVLTEQGDKDILASADKYIALLAQVDIQKNNEKIDNLGKMLEDLPALDEVTLADAEKLDEINEALKEVDLTLEISDAGQQILDKIESYNEKINDLKVAENDKKAEEIAVILETLPAIEEFEKAETYTDEVMENLENIKALLDLIDETGVSEENKATVDLAKEYAAKLEYYDTLKNAELIEEIESILEVLPATDSFEYTRENEEMLGKLSNLCDELVIEKLTSAQKAVHEEAKEYIVLLKNFPPVSKTLNPDLFVNYGRTYYDSFGAAGISNNYGITWSEFIKRDEWRNSWSASSDVEDNIFVTDKAEYIVRVDKGTGKNNVYSAKSGTTIGYDTLDVDDGKYTKMIFLGCGTNHGCSYAGLQFNYDDGTNSGFIQLPIGGILTTKADGTIELEGKKSTQQSNGTYLYEKIKIYLREYEFENPNPDKTVVSVSIPYRNVTIKDGVLTPMAVTGGGGAYAYDIRWFGMTLLQTSNEYKNVISDKFTALDGVKEEDAKAALAEVDELVQNAVMMGMDITNIEGYDIYKALSDKYVRIFGYEKESDLKNVSVSVTFASDVDIEKSDIKLLKGEKEQDFEFLYENNIAKVTFRNDFDYTEEYTVKLSKDIASKKDSSSTLGNEATYSFTIPVVIAFSSFDVSEGTDNITVGFTLNNYLINSTDALVTICVIDGDNKMIDSTVVKGTDIKKGENMSASDIVLKTTEGYTIKVFVIDGMEKMNTIYKYNYQGGNLK